MFPEHLISLRCEIEWPPRSPYLNLCDLFLWGYLKGQVYKNRTQNVQQLMEAIREEIALIPRAMLEKVMQNFRERL